MLGPYFITSWVPIGSLFLSLEVPKSFRNSGYLQEINLITAATTIKNSDLQKQEFQQLAKTKEIRNGDPVMHAFWALYSPLALCSMYPMHNPLSPICSQYNLCAKKVLKYLLPKGAKQCKHQEIDSTRVAIDHFCSQSNSLPSTSGGRRSSSGLRLTSREELPLARVRETRWNRCLVVSLSS